MFGPTPFVAFGPGAEVDAAAVAMTIFAGDAIRDAAAFGAVAVIGVHVGDVVLAETIHKAHIVGIAAKDPGELPISERRKEVGVGSMAVRMEVRGG